MKPIRLPDKMTLGRLMILPFRCDPLYYTIDLLMLIVRTAIAPLSVLLTARFVDTALGIWSGTQEPGDIVLPIVLLTLFKFFEPIFDFILSPILLKKEEHVWRTLDHPLKQRAASLELKYLEDSELLSELGQFVMSGEGGWYLLGFSDFLKRLIFGGVQMVSYLILLYRYVPWVIPVAGLLCIPTFFLSRQKEKDSFEQQKRYNYDGRLNGRYFGYLSGRKAACERSMFDYSDMVTDMYVEKSKKVTYGMQAHNFKWGLRGNLNSIAAYIVCFIAIAFMTPALTGGQITLGVFTSMIQLLVSFIPQIISDFTNNVFFYQSFRRDVRLVNKFLSLTADTDIIAPMSENPPVFETLEMRNVSFTYPGTEKKILDNVSLTIHAGTKYALVGENGSGKSTLIKLLLRLYDDYTGEILLNGKDLRDWNRGDIKAIFSAVMQNYSKYEISLEDNINVGSGFRANERDVDRAILLSGLSDAVGKLKEGKKTMLGKLHENGADLSGGEWQRVAMARAIINSSGLKILDEPTAALDPIAERDFYNKFDEMTRGSATIFISHRLASAKMADCIFVLADGTITEQGNHEQLMAKHGLYAEMFESQRGWYL